MPESLLAGLSMGRTPAMKRKEAAIHETLDITESKAVLVGEFTAIFESYFFASGAEEGVHDVKKATARG